MPSSQIYFRKSHEVSGKKILSFPIYNKKNRQGGGRNPPVLLGLNIDRTAIRHVIYSKFSCAGLKTPSLIENNVRPHRPRRPRCPRFRLSSLPSRKGGHGGRRGRRGRELKVGIMILTNKYPLYGPLKYLTHSQIRASV